MAPRSLLRALEPRDPAASARILLIGWALVGSGSVAWEVVMHAFGRDGVTPGSSLVSVGSVAAFGLLILAVRRRPERVPALVWPAIAVLQPVAATTIALLARDASAGSQIGLLYGVVYAASQLRPAVAWCVTGWAVALDALVVGLLLPAGEAVADLVVVGVSLPYVTAVMLMATTAQDRLIRRLDELATTDALTGLASRRGLEAATAAALVGRRPGDAAPHVGLVLVDVDHFKQINDRHGHPAGDAALVRLGHLLRGVAGPSDLAARLGGDELALLVRGDADLVARRAGAVLAAVRDADVAGPDGAGLRVSIGHAAAGPATDAEALYAAADRALYAAKVAGRDRTAAADVEGCVAPA
ncbi:GGDEF domain-containing protein [Cellulomonas endophytica]|uniref:GGDEF domain-containing protein n=1 Tax=Cellulomonas endophytica TaxID=2494735 RepID=UPI001012C5CC|nr:GGDEF domain-containing protein [Cellulomonas endophytica]